MFLMIRQAYWKISLNVTAFWNLMHDYQVRNLIIWSCIMHLATVLSDSYLLCPVDACVDTEQWMAKGDVQE